MSMFVVVLYFLLQIESQTTVPKLAMFLSLFEKHTDTDIRFCISVGLTDTTSCGGGV